MRVCNGLHQMLLKLPTKRKLSFYICVVKKYEEYWCKNMRNTGAKIVHLCTIATIIMHIYTVTIACAFNILLVFSLSCLYSHSHSHLTLSLFLLSPHLTSPHYPFVSAKFACGYRAKLVFAGSESGGFGVGIFVVRDKAFIFFLFFFFHKPIFIRQVK